MHRAIHSAFGVMFDKAWLFQQGTRPVIYQADAEFADLPEALRWRHVRYEPSAKPAVDFSWGREWRVRADELHFNPGVATVVLPNRAWFDALVARHDDAQEAQMDYLMMGGMSQQEAEAHRQAFPWSGIWLE